MRRRGLNHLLIGAASYIAMSVSKCVRSILWVLASLEDLKGSGRQLRMRRSSGTEMLLVFAKQKLVGHSRDVIANGDGPPIRSGRFLVGSRHRLRRIEVINKKFFQAANGAIPVLGDSRVVVNVREKKALQFSVAFGKRVTETRKSARCAAYVLHACGSRSDYAITRGFDEIGGKTIEHALQCGIEFEFLAATRVCGIDLRVCFGEDRNFLP